MRRKRLFSLCVVALLLGVLAGPALTVSAAEHEDVAPVHRADTALKRSQNEGESLSSAGLLELIQRILEWALQRGLGPPDGIPADPPVRPEYVPTIDPSGYAPDRN